MSNIDEKNKTSIYDAEIIIKGGKPFFNPREEHIRELRKMNFVQGSALFESVFKNLQKMDYIPHPDDPGGPVPDPFGILSGEKFIPWQLLNPVVKKCIRCISTGDGGVECFDTPCDPTPVS